jgi:hypothetical protein
MNTEETTKPTPEQCPNGCGPLEEFWTGKDNYVSNSEVEIYLGRIVCMGCPECKYIGHIWND